MNEYKIFIGCYNKSVILTYVGIALALLGIVIQLSNSGIQHREIYGAMLLALAGICDLFDGPVARKVSGRTAKDKAFGVQIDSLADVIISLILPVTIIYNMVDKKYAHLAIVAGVVYVVCGVIRLAYFNITVEENMKYYSGIPVTYMALILPLLIFLETFIYSAPNIAGISNIASILYITLLFIMSILFILNIKIPKPRGIWYAVFSILAIVTTLRFIWILT